MNGEWTGLTWEKLDRLADYTAGTLTGAEADEVAHLITTDERWAAAHAELLAAQPAVSAALRSAAETPVAMPADVAARLEAALADARTDRLASVRRSRPHRVRPGRRSRWSPVLLRIAAGVLALAAVGGLGTVVLRTILPAMETVDAAGEAGESLVYADQAAGPPSADADVATGAGIRVLASGTDYTTATLHQLVDAVRSAPAQTAAEREAELGGLTVDNALTEVASPEGLARCLAAVRQAYPGVTAVVDFARFEGQPAVVIAVHDGRAWTVVAVAVGCGDDGLIELASVSVQ
jgi:hypothetical protein